MLETGVNCLSTGLYDCRKYIKAIVVDIEGSELDTSGNVNTTGRKVSGSSYQKSVTWKITTLGIRNTQPLVTY
jgi:hypothetical protein